MIAEFNGVIYLGVYILILIGTAYYTYLTVFQTNQFLEKYDIDQSGAFMVRFSGTFLMPVVILMIYMLIKGISGNWIFFVYGFLQAVSATLIGYWTVEKSGFKTSKGEKFNSEGYISPIGFSIAWLVVIYGTSGVIYI
jgi:hypothetical protein